MVDLFGVDTNLWVAGAAAAQTIIVGAAAGFAYRQVREAKLTREDQSRPFVILEFDLSRPLFIHLVIKNIGRTMARRVRIQTDPPLASTFDTKGQREPVAKLRVFAEEIPTMAPDREIRTLFDSFPDREGQKLDDVYRVTITYEGERGRSYVDEMVLDLGIYRNITYIEQHTIHDVHKQLKKIAEELRRWSGSGLKVVSRKDEREDYALAVRRFRARSDSSLAPREASEPAARWALRRLRERASRALAIVSAKVDPDR
jgi:hypothetical protein